MLILYAPNFKKICNNENGEKMPFFDNIPYSVIMHTQKTAAM